MNKLIYLNEIQTFICHLGPIKSGYIILRDGMGNRYVCIIKGIPKVGYFLCWHGFYDQILKYNMTKEEISKKIDGLKKK